jgi:hypothetical protein
VARHWGVPPLAAPTALSQITLISQAPLGARQMKAWLRHRILGGGGWRRLALASLICLACSASAAAERTASPLNYTLRLDSTLAPQLAGRHIADFSDANRSFGAPTQLRPAATAQTCSASWSRLGLAITFASASTSSCAAKTLGRWLTVTASSSGWQTAAGLAVGDSERRLHTLYPQTRQLDFLGLGRLWELETGGPFCDGGPPLALAARVRAGLDSALMVVHVPACG